MHRMVYGLHLLFKCLLGGRIGFSCITHRFAGNSSGCCESFLCLQFGKGELESRVGEGRFGGRGCGIDGDVKRIRVTAPLHSQGIHPNSFLAVPALSLINKMHTPGGQS